MSILFVLSSGTLREPWMILVPNRLLFSSIPWCGKAIVSITAVAQHWQVGSHNHQRISLSSWVSLLLASQISWLYAQLPGNLQVSSRFWQWSEVTSQPASWYIWRKTSTFPKRWWGTFYDLGSLPSWGTKLANTFSSAFRTSQPLL